MLERERHCTHLCANVRKPPGQDGDLECLMLNDSLDTVGILEWKNQLNTVFPGCRLFRLDGGINLSGASVAAYITGGMDSSKFVVVV